MKAKLFAIMFALALLAIPVGSRADCYVRGDSDCPWRYVAYVLHPFGIAAEYGVLRPINWLVSQPDLCIIFGAHSTNDMEPVTHKKCNYFKWE